MAERGIMSFASRHNKGGINWGVITDGFVYRNLAELYKQNPKAVYILRGIYINRQSRYGDAPVAILDSCFVNLPQHLLETAQDMLQEPETIQDIKAGRAGFEIETYTSREGRLCYGVRWLDIQEPEKAVTD